MFEVNAFIFVLFGEPIAYPNIYRYCRYFIALMSPIHFCK